MNFTEPSNFVYGRLGPSGRYAVPWPNAPVPFTLAVTKGPAVSCQMRTYLDAPASERPRRREQC